MNCRRDPFQFTTSDPEARRSELLKRFGIPSDSKDMLVETPDSPVMDAFSSAASCSPRLQHRIPVFRERSSRNDCTESSQNVNNVGSKGHQPRVRVIPIQIEDGSSVKSSRQRTYSGGCDPVQRSPHLSDKFSHSEDHLPSKVKSPTSVVNGQKLESKPRVCNIPIVIEDKKEVKRKPEKVAPSKKSGESPKKSVKSPSNGSCVSTDKNIVQKQVPEKPPVTERDVSLKVISEVLNNFQSYKADVEQFNGSYGDKKYRYLDEMLTQCMLKLDNVETYGNNEIRKARKDAIHQVQDCLNLLESTAQKPQEVLQTTGDSKFEAGDSQNGGETNVVGKADENMEVEQDTPVEAVKEQEADTSSKGDEVMDVEQDSKTTKDAEEVDMKDEGDQEMQVESTPNTAEVESTIEISERSEANVQNRDNVCKTEIQVEEISNSAVDSEQCDSASEKLYNTVSEVSANCQVEEVTDDLCGKSVDKDIQELEVSEDKLSCDDSETVSKVIEEVIVTTENQENSNRVTCENKPSSEEVTISDCVVNECDSGKSSELCNKAEENVLDCQSESMEVS